MPHSSSRTVRMSRCRVTEQYRPRRPEASPFQLPASTTPPVTLMFRSPPENGTDMVSRHASASANQLFRVELDAQHAACYTCVKKRRVVWRGNWRKAICYQLSRSLVLDGTGRSTCWMLPLCKRSPCGLTLRTAESKFLSAIFGHLIALRISSRATVANLVS